MPVNDVCGSCGFRHNVAHRCPVRRLDASMWLGSDVNAWPEPVPVHMLSEFNVVCPYCRARFWRGESIDCCGRGRLQLSFGDRVPDDIAEVIHSAHVRAHIRRLLIVLLACVFLQVTWLLGTTCRLRWPRQGTPIALFPILLLFWAEDRTTAWAVCIPVRELLRRLPRYICWIPRKPPHDDLKWLGISKVYCVNLFLKCCISFCRDTIRGFGSWSHRLRTIHRTLYGRVTLTFQA